MHLMFAYVRIKYKYFHNIQYLMYFSSITGNHAYIQNNTMCNVFSYFIKMYI